MAYRRKTLCKINVLAQFILSQLQEITLQSLWLVALQKGMTMKNPLVEPILSKLENHYKRECSRDSFVEISARMESKKQGDRKMQAEED